MRRMKGSDAGEEVTVRAVRGRIPGSIALGLAVVAALVVLFVPLGQTTSSTGSFSSAGEAETTTTWSSTTLLESEGLRIVVIVAIPVAVVAGGVAAVFLGWRKTAAACAVLIWILIVLGAFSIGLILVPSGLALLIAASIAWATPPQRRRTEDRPRDHGLAARGR